MEAEGLGGEVTVEYPGAGAGLHRRTLVKGAGWAAPVVALSAAAPAFAASCPSGQASVAPSIVAAASGRAVAQWDTVPLTVTIPASACDIRYTIQGAGGGWQGGRGAYNSGTITRSNPAASLTLTIIAGAPGLISNANSTDGNVGGGKGYGNGGTTSWLGYTNGGSAHSSAGGGGGGSAILLGALADNLPLVVAGGGAGSASGWESGLGTSAMADMGRPAPDAGFPGMNPAGSSLPSQMSSARPWFRAMVVNATEAFRGFGVGTGSNASAPAFGANGGTGGAAAHASTAGTGSAALTTTGGPWYGGTLYDSSKSWATYMLGTAGGNHGTGGFGGGNGGSGNGNPPSSYPSWFSDHTDWCPGGSGGGGYAGGGGGMTFKGFLTNTSNESHGASYGTAGGGGSSYITTASTSGGGNTVTVTPDSWSLTSNPVAGDGVSYNGLAGSVTITWG